MHVETSGAAKCPSPSRLRGRGVDVGLPTLFFIGNSDLLKRKEKRMFTEHTLERYVF